MAGKTPNYSAHDALSATMSRFVDVENMAWDEQAPKMKMKCLFKDDEREEAIYLMKAEPGAQIPEHFHTGIEFTFVLEGSMEDAEGKCTAGNFVWRPFQSKHAVQLPNGGMFLTFFRGSAQRTATGSRFPAYQAKAAE